MIKSCGDGGGFDRYGHNNDQSSGYDQSDQGVGFDRNDGGGRLDMIEMIKVGGVIVSVDMAALIVLEETFIMIIVMMGVLAVKDQYCI